MSNEDYLHYNADRDLFVFAKKNRKTPTEAENLLWRHVRNRQCANLKFRRQHPISYELEKLEIRVIRFTNKEVLENIGLP